MSSKILVGDDVPEVAINIVPFSIQYSGNADTRTFFTPSKRSEVQLDQPIETAQFRGLKLVGEKECLGDKIGQVVVCSEVLERDDASDEIRTVKQYSGVAKFLEFTVYGHDSLPLLTNKWKLLGEWEKIAEVIHSP